MVVSILAQATTPRLACLSFQFLIMSTKKQVAYTVESAGNPTYVGDLDRDATIAVVDQGKQLIDIRESNEKVVQDLNAQVQEPIASNKETVEDLVHIAQAREETADENKRLRAKVDELAAQVLSLKSEASSSNPSSSTGTPRDARPLSKHPYVRAMKRVADGVSTRSTAWETKHDISREILQKEIAAVKERVEAAQKRLQRHDLALVEQAAKKQKRGADKTKQDQENAKKAAENKTE